MTKSKQAAQLKTKNKRRTPKKRPAPRKPSKVVEHINWQGITIAVSYEADWLGMSEKHPQFATAHLEIEAIEPPKQELPITETGYRSHFVARALVDQAGGPLAYARTWLDEAAKAPAWKKRQEQSRQLCLF